MTESACCIDKLKRNRKSKPFSPPNCGEFDQSMGELAKSAVLPCVPWPETTPES